MARAHYVLRLMALEHASADVAGAGGPSADRVPKPVATAVLFADTHPDRFALSVRSLMERTDLNVVVGTLYNAFAADFTDLGHDHPDRITVRPMGSVSELCNRVYEERRTNLIVINDAVVLPPQPFDQALAWMRDDLRVATVSFLSNAADFLSFPIRNLPADRPPDGHDEVSITRLLREVSPPAAPTPIMYAAGAVVLVSAAALGAVGDIVAPASARFDIAIADFSVRARAKGFVDLVDTSTFVNRPSDVAIRPIAETLTHDDRGWLLHRHQSMVAFLDHERMSGDSPFAMAHQVARVKVDGLRILIDGSCFGPNEVGTQVATLHTIRALTERSDVREVVVALPGSVPAYAAATLTAPKVRAFQPPGGDLHAAGPVDIAYRPYQPVPGWELHRWRVAGVRLVVGILDTIAFHNGGYFDGTNEWMAYRQMILDSVRVSDAVTVISDDVATQMVMHGFPIDAERVAAVPLGTEHLRGDDPARLPSELHARGFAAGEFALCLGVNYSHKNRELATLAHEELRSRGFDLALVLAGPSVPRGTTRVAESRIGAKEHVFVLPEVAGVERNWLLRHASIVWYPTSAEGFGLVPFEAAAFGTPTVAVDFGPIRELASGDGSREAGRSPFGSDVPVLAADWTPEALADAAERLLRDPDLALRHAETLRAAARHYSWSTTAAALVDLFRSTLARPRR